MIFALTFEVTLVREARSRPFVFDRGFTYSLQEISVDFKTFLILCVGLVYSSFSDKIMELCGSLVDVGVCPHKRLDDYYSGVVLTE